MKLEELLQSDIRVVNIGLWSFAHDLEDRNVPLVHIDWSPPAGGNPRITDLLAKLGS